MNVKIRNRSNKKRSKSAMSELRLFAVSIAKKLKIESHIDEVRIFYSKEFNGYYPKGKPMYGFHKMYNNRVVTINLAKHWDVSQNARKEAIVHELTHVKQMAARRLMVVNKFRDVLWNGHKCESWKKWRFKEFESLKGKAAARKYLRKYLPWEREVQNNLDRYL